MNFESINVEPDQSSQVSLGNGHGSEFRIWNSRPILISFCFCFENSDSCSYEPMSISGYTDIFGLSLFDGPKVKNYCICRACNGLLVSRMPCHRRSRLILQETRFLTCTLASQKSRVQR